MRDVQDLEALKRAHPSVGHWLALPTDRTSHAVRMATGVLTGARLASRRFYRSETGYASATGPEVDLCVCREPVTVGIGDPSFLRLLERASADRVGLVLLAPSVGDEALATLAVNSQRGSLNGMALVADAPALDAIAALFQISASPADGLHAHRLHLDEVLATAQAAAFLGPGGATVGLVSVGGPSHEAMWRSWHAMVTG